jgi:hypothetical protein
MFACCPPAILLAAMQFDELSTANLLGGAAALPFAARAESGRRWRAFVYLSKLLSKVHHTRSFHYKSAFL